MTRPMHRVSVKIALRTPDGEKVLMTRLEGGQYGLPGGHIENGETPEQAILRELHEELGITYGGPLEQARFWKDPEGERILLGYVGQLDESTTMTFQLEEIIGVQWATRDDVRKGVFNTPTYREFLEVVFEN